MTENYTVSYSGDALNDLREIYTYIANELLVPETAAAQVGAHPKRGSFLGFHACTLRISRMGTVAFYGNVPVSSEQLYCVLSGRL